MFHSAADHAAELVNVDRRRFASEFNSLAISNEIVVEQRTELRQTPAQLRARIVWSLPQQLANALAQLRAAGGHQIREQRTRFLGRRKRDGRAVPLHLQLAKEPDLEHIGSADLTLSLRTPG